MNAPEWPRPGGALYHLFEKVSLALRAMKRRSCKFVQREVVEIIFRP